MLPLPFVHEIFLLEEDSETQHRRVPLRSFRHCGTKKRKTLVIFSRMCNMQGISFIQYGQFYFFFGASLTILSIQKQMTAVGLGQKSSDAVNWSFEALSCQLFLRFTPKNF